MFQYNTCVEQSYNDICRLSCTVQLLLINFTPVL